MPNKFVIGFLVIVIFIGIGVQPALAELSDNFDEETILEVNARVFGIGRIKYIVVTVKNIGDEKVKIQYLPGGGFEINNSEQRVYRTPFVPIRLYHSMTLYPELSRIFFSWFWFVFDDDGNILPNGDYFVKGFIWPEGGTLYSESARFHLGLT